MERRHLPPHTVVKRTRMLCCAIVQLALFSSNDPGVYVQLSTSSANRTSPLPASSRSQTKAKSPQAFSPHQFLPQKFNLFCPLSGPLDMALGLPLPLFWVPTEPPLEVPPEVAGAGGLLEEAEAGGTGRGGGGVDCSFCRSCAKWKSSCSSLSFRGRGILQRGQV